MRQPTRDGHLLDLVLTDSADVLCRVLPKLADHSVVETTLVLEFSDTTAVQREVWDFAKADWDKLDDLLENTDWGFLDHATTDDAAAQLTETLLDLLGRCVGKQRLNKTRAHTRGLATTLYDLWPPKTQQQAFLVW